MQTIVNLIDFGMNPQAAVDAPRFHHQWQPDLVTVEAGYLSGASRSGLEAMGYRFVTGSPWGAAEVISVAPAGHGLLGGSDSRRQSGAAFGL